jgi:hypothetical protein
MSAPMKHFPAGKLKKLSKKRLNALHTQIKQLIKADPMMRAIVASNKEMTKVVKKKLSKKFRELR